MFKRHENFHNIIWALGYIDSNGAVHGEVVTREMTKNDSATSYHCHWFPNANRFKLWRWDSHSGLSKSPLSMIDMDGEDYDLVINWLYKQGCLNDWEIPDGDPYLDTLKD